MQKLLLASLSSLKRVGPSIEKLLTKLVLQNKIFNLLLHRPSAVEKILFNPRIFEVSNNELILIKIKIESHIKPQTKRQPYKIVGYNPTGYVNLIFFKIFPSQIAKLSIGLEVFVLGHLQKVAGENQIAHPEQIYTAEQINNLSQVNVIYPLTAGITQKFLRQKIVESLQILNAKNLAEEWIDHHLLASQNWPSFAAALNIIHNPQKPEDLLPQNFARKRLAYDELFAWQLALMLVKKAEAVNKKPEKIEINLADQFLSAMPFKPTAAQVKAAIEIKQDMISNKKMLRLLQGDVGSGKTVIAIYACLLALSQGKQSCVVVPITILAEQHLGYFQKMLQILDFASFKAKKPVIELLTSKQTKKQKTKILQDLSAGEIDILISTHAVLQDDVVFKNLALAVIDEQHRFGVMQRLKLIEKGADVDVLLMSATPIPRSLMMTIYGDMDISIISEKPSGRKEIETLVMSENKKITVFAAIKRAIAKQEKIYWICPAIEQNQEIDLVAAEEKYQELCDIFGEKKVALIHGKMKESQKEKVMQSFTNKGSDALQILVATTVIEVGIDVKDATIIVIENAENFGLSQLHQLRGRVGRGDKQSYCILLYGKKYGAKGRERLSILKQSNDGFFIAEEDLKMRGAGELLGTKQSGVPEFKIADLAFDMDLIKIAHKNAQLVLNRDLQLQSSESAKYRDLLELFDYDRCLKIVGSG